MANATVWWLSHVHGRSIARWFMRRTRRTPGDADRAVVRQAGVKWSFEFERSWCSTLRWHSSSAGQWMSEFFMEQPETAETNVVREDVHQRVPNNYRLRVAQLRKASYESPKGAQHLHETVISQGNVYFFFFVTEKSLLSWRGYISDPKSITSTNKILVCKKKTETIGFINLTIGNAFGKW